MSENLKLFYRAYWKWIQDGAPEYEPFSRAAGLCDGLLHMGHDKHTMWKLRTEMQSQFAMAGLDVYYPFGEKAYTTASMKRTMHRSLHRLKWVKENMK